MVSTMFVKTIGYGFLVIIDKPNGVHNTDEYE